MAEADTSRKRFHETFAEDIIAGLKNGTVPWIKPWKAGELELPFNPVSGTHYKGMNLVQLVGKGLYDPRWMTLKQANSEDWRIQKGASSTRVVYWQFTKKEPVLDDAGRPMTDDAGNAVTKNVRLERPLMSVANVFHASQVNGEVPEWLPRPQTWADHTKAENLIRASGAVIVHDQRDKAVYRPGPDEIHMPPRGAFSGDGEYYATLLHELGHWHCDARRMNLGFNGPFGSDAYAREELRVEIASWMTCMEMGLPYAPAQHLAYVASWISALEKDPYEIVRACRDAEHIKERILGVHLEQGVSMKVPAQSLTPEQPERGKHLGESGNERHWLDVPFVEKNKAKVLGARWDRTEKRWYAPEGTDFAALAAWHTHRDQLNQQSKEAAPSLPPEAEFAERLREAGLMLEGLPVMDGAIHRIPVAGRERSRDGAYRGNLDGHPAGWFQNHVTGETANWKYSGHSLNPEQIRLMREQAEQKRELEAQQRREVQEKAAKRCFAIWKNAAWARDEQDYLHRKGIPSFGVKVDGQGNLLIPGRDVTGFIKTLQTVTPGGKLFERGTSKTGAFHVLDPDRSFGSGVILIAEGYATAASVHMATGQPCVCAFDAGNLVHVAKALREKYPDAPMVCMADNDVRNPENPGINKARLAMDAVAGMVLAPQFTPEEIEQGLNDWNDLHAAHGIEELRRQIDFSRPLYQALMKNEVQKQDHKKEITPGKAEKSLSSLKEREQGLAL